MITLGHRGCLNKCQRISVVNSMFSNKKAIKLQINKKILKNDHNDSKIKHGLNVDHAFERYSLENFVWIRHKNTSTELLTNSPIRNRKLEKEIQIDPDRFKLLFGVELDKIILNK